MLFKQIKTIRDNGVLGKWLAKVLPDASWVTYLLGARVFQRSYGLWPRVRRPRTFNEWLFAQKVTTPRSCSYAPWVDKHLAKKSVAELMEGAETPCLFTKTLHYTTSAEDPYFLSELPRCVVKGTHGSGMTILVKEPRHLTDDERALLKQWLLADYFWGSREPSYRHLQPGIITEEFLPCEGLVPEDYKFFCFRGEVAFIQHDRDRYIDQRRCLYSPEWKPLTVTLKRKAYSDHAPAPKDLPSMLAIAKRLSAGQDFVRVDLYQTNEGVYFGEMTFTPGSGLQIFTPNSFDALVYERWLKKEPPLGRWNLAEYVCPAHS